MLAVVDGLKGFPDAITAVFPEAVVQTCIVGSLKNLSSRDSLDLIAIGVGMLGRKERD